MSNIPSSAAIADYHYLTERSYSEKNILKIVGDRYKLSGIQRSVLYRGICRSDQAQTRISKIVNSPSNELIVDGYNVLFTLINYSVGRLVFLSLDSLCRDAGFLTGKNWEKPLIFECAKWLYEYLLDFADTRILIVLDSPVKNSSKHCKLLKELFKMPDRDIGIQLTKNADIVLLQYPESTLATSDTGIVDACKNPILDIPKAILTTRFKANLFDIREVLNLLPDK